MTEWEGLQIPMGMKLLFSCRTMPELVLAAELCEDVWVPCPPSISHALAGATVIANCSASDETTGKDRYRYDLICGQSARLVCGYIYANAGEGESTQDLVFGGQNIIAEMVPAWYSPTGLKMPASVQIWILEESSANAAV